MPAVQKGGVLQTRASCLQPGSWGAGMTPRRQDQLRDRAVPCRQDRGGPCCMWGNCQRSGRHPAAHPDGAVRQRGRRAAGLQDHQCAPPLSLLPVTSRACQLVSSGRCPVLLGAVGWLPCLHLLPHNGMLKRWGCHHYYCWLCGGQANQYTAVANNFIVLVGLEQASLDGPRLFAKPSTRSWHGQACWGGTTG